MFAVSAFVAQTINPTTEGGTPGLDGPVQVRLMRSEECEFVAECLVNGFNEKFSRCVGKKKLKKVVQARKEGLEASREEQGRIWLATVNEQPAGIMKLLFKNDDIEDESPYCSTVGCMGSLGLICMGCVLEEKVSDDDDCYLAMITVSDIYRGKGIGRLLLARAEHEAKDRECTTMSLWVARDSPARKLYERIGYTTLMSEDGCLLTFVAVGIRHWVKMVKYI